MTIANIDDYIGGVKQSIPFTRTSARTTVAGIWFALLDLAGNPGSGTLAAGNTANGVVPTDATSGYPGIGFSTGNGHLSIVSFANTVAGRLAIADRLFHVGAISFAAATTTLSSQPSYSARIPGGTVYDGLQIWLEVTTAFVTGNNWSVIVNYTNQAGVTAHATVTTGALAVAALTLGKRLQLALQAGDTGVQKIESVVVTNGATAMTVGAFNILVLRPLWNGRVVVANGGDCHALDRAALPQVWTDSALDFSVCPDSTSSGLPDFLLQIASK